ncbi:hypothetical protein B9Z65_19 [Elsinoe australis]|uniref:Uncharacterized protein n=1 Tax=Elsinoe australis TaxID=40998 RepID=A0A2P7YWH9_9PEZI|nr:hypothetical protein B9Z65_19 [Elsinoe australis]
MAEESAAILDLSWNMIAAMCGFNADNDYSKNGGGWGTQAKTAFGNLVLTDDASDLAKLVFDMLQQDGEDQIHGITELQNKLGFEHGPTVAALEELGYVRQIRFQEAGRSQRQQMRTLVLPKNPSAAIRAMYEACKFQGMTKDQAEKATGLTRRKATNARKACGYIPHPRSGRK